MRSLGRCAALAIGLALPTPACAAPQPKPAIGCAANAPYDGAIERAAQRFAMSPALIRAVIAAESAGKVFAVSSKGAMGLMQLMPATYRELRDRHGLGTDPFDPCDNILAGTAYLRALLDRYGDPGFLAAYNAGPGRYEAYLRGRKRLPAETIAYVARLSQQMLAPPTTAEPRAAPDPDAWRRSGLFAGTPEGVETEEQTRAPGSPDTLFVTRKDTPQ